MKTNLISFLSLTTLLFLSGCTSATDHSGDKLFKPAKESTLKAPAYPLITIDPYTSAWSFTDNLNEDIVRHWTGQKFPLLGVLRVDGTSYRFMGINDIPLITIIPTAATQKWDAAYTENKPSGDWKAVDYNDSAWQKGKAAFGTSDMPHLSTLWESKDIWVRRTFDLPQDYTDKQIVLEYSHDDDFELFINGIEVVSTGYSWNNNVLLELSEEVRKTLVPGKNIITAHGHNRTGGALVDFGLFYKDENIKSFGTAAIQKSVQVLPTQTYYTFTCGPVELDLIFTAPLLLDDPDLISTPVNYISYQVRPTDENSHDIQIYFEATPDWAKNTPEQETETSVSEQGTLVFAKAGTTEQPILQKKGDNVRIDWGYFYLASEKKNKVIIQAGDPKKIKDGFINEGFASLLKTQNKKEKSNTDVMIFCENIGKTATPSNGFMMIGYDDIYAIQYFHDNRPAYWKHNGNVDIIQAFEKASGNYLPIMKRCAAFDTKMMTDAEKVGGKEYAELCALAYRQAVSAHKLIEDKEGNLLFLSKENFSNGSIGTVDITYPSSPLFLIYNPDLLKGMMNPIFYYSESGQWNKPFPSHDVGTYPIANGQTYGGDMPVEESGNMLILTTAIAMVEGNADYAKKHWEVLTTWANYLMKEGLDPENQLCTDDFAGHFAHNANLSVKAIMGIAGYGKLAQMLGDNETAKKYTDAAKDMAQQWMQMADDGDHYRLTFDKPGTWSQKYNLIWDKLFGTTIFPEEVAKKEVAYYLTKQNKYGLPLDNRESYTKTDWIIWSACLADNTEDFRQLMLPVHVYAGETVSRIPLSDWHDTHDSHSMNFRARSVVGGYFMKMLEEKMTKK
ncbi:DUF4965 domain-containing protein [Bacteroides sp. OttesenSCG-928-D19]|nr:DUF4965 domain-containing protein [Bacteroides sp. OttesenSCG-928-D19]